MQAINSELLDALPAGNAKQAQATNYRNLDFYSFPNQGKKQEDWRYSLLMFLLSS